MRLKKRKIIGDDVVSPLNKFKILIADSDQHLSGITKVMLNGMGFPNITLTHSGTKALELMGSQEFDFMITDWNLKDLDGIDMLHKVRRDQDSPNPTLPVLMLTGRMEKHDVQVARDSGIHEYVIKPASTQSIFNRLERIVDAPRHFVVSPGYVGPDRRHKDDPKSQEMRAKALPAQRKPIDYSQALDPTATPQLWMPDFTLKHKLGRDVRLESIITPAILKHAQAEVNASASLLREWIDKDIALVKSLLAMIETRPDKTEAIMLELIEVSLAISSRSGTFGYKRAAEVAYLMYLFFRKEFRHTNENHYVVVDKHIQVLRFIFEVNILNEEGDILSLIQELKRLATKYTI